MQRLVSVMFAALRMSLAGTPTVVNATATPSVATRFVTMYTPTTTRGTSTAPGTIARSVSLYLPTVTSDTQGGGQTSLYATTFPGANNAPWPSPAAASYNGGTGSVDQQLNAGRLQTPAVAYSTARVMIPYGNVPNVEAVCRIRLTSTAEQYFQIGLRGNGVWQGSNQQAGYALNTDALNGHIALNKYSGTTITQLDFGTFAFSANVWYWVKIQTNSNVIRARLWMDGTGEPGSWNLESTDSEFTGGTTCHLRHLSGAAATARRCDVDDLTINTITTGGEEPPPPPPSGGGVPTVIGGVQLFPANNFWYATVNALPVRSDSAQRINGTMANNYKFSGFGYNNDVTLDAIMTYDVIPSNQANVPLTFTESWSAAESDGTPMPFPLTATPEANSDRHIIAVQQGTNLLYEAWLANRTANGWAVGQASRWDLTTNNYRRAAGITSADAAGLPMLPGTVRYEEIAAGQINHALRITVDFCSAEYEWPARHIATFERGVANELMKMGTWLRLKSSVNLSTKGLGAQATIIANALKKHGAVVIDIGPNWKLTGAPSGSWNFSDLNTLRNLIGTDFEVVDTSSLKISNDSMEVDTSGTTTPPTNDVVSAILEAESGTLTP